MRSVAVSFVAALLLTTVGCSGEVSVGTPTLSQEKVEQELSSKLAETVGRAPESIRCPDDLPGRVDQQMRCRLDDGDTELGVTVTVTSVKGTTILFDYAVDETPVEQ